MINHQCDKCAKKVEGKKGESYHLPTDWFSLTFGRYDHRVQYQLCPECREALKIPAEAPEATIGDRLLEIISELVTEEVEANTE